MRQRLKGVSCNSRWPLKQEEVLVGVRTYSESAEKGKLALGYGSLTLHDRVNPSNVWGSPWQTLKQAL